eukprot:scaffold1166_cov261-Pinguiococcus_pyrenoidosus.AAC.21
MPAEEVKVPGEEVERSAPAAIVWLEVGGHVESKLEVDRHALPLGRFPVLILGGLEENPGLDERPAPDEHPCSRAAPHGPGLSSGGRSRVGGVDQLP